MTVRIELQEQGIELKKLRDEMGLNRKDFAEYFEIPLRTVEDWEACRRKMPIYLFRLMEYKVKTENLLAEQKRRQENNMQEEEG